MATNSFSRHSAILTEAGCQSNREVCIQLSHEDYCFDSLLKLYNSYWDQAEVLNEDRLQTYLNILNHMPQEVPKFVGEKPY